MAILHGRDLFSPKYITAEIKDASKRLWYVPIKHTIGDYFLADIGGQIYCFKIDNEICQYREKLTKSFRIIQYDTTHYRPIKSDVTELRMILEKNDLPRVDGMLANIFRILGSKEKKEFVEVLQPDGTILKKEIFSSHKLKDMIEELSKYNQSDTGKVIPYGENKYAAQIESIIQYLNNLNVEEITTPVRSISEFIEDDLRATDPKFLGTVATTLQSLDFENKKVTNTPIKSTLAWAKWGLAIMMIVMIAFVIYYGYEQGWFDSFLSIGEGFEGLGSVIPAPGAFESVAGKDDKYYQDNFTPESLRAAIDRGEIDEDSLPSATKEMVRNVKSPTVQEIQP